MPAASSTPPAATPRSASRRSRRPRSPTSRRRRWPTGSRTRSTTPEIANTSGLVAIDELGNTFNDGRVKITYSWKSVRGKRIRVASHNRLVVTRTGYRIAKGAAPLPVIDPASPGAKLSVAMEILASRPHAAGGSYAERVHLYIAPAFGTSIAAGRGPHRHLGNDGKPHRATWRGSHAGPRPRRRRLDRDVPPLRRSRRPHHDRPRVAHRPRRDVPNYARRFGADTSRMHLLMSAAGTGPTGVTGCGTPMACQWGLAGSTREGAAILANGPGAYRLGVEAAAWRAEYNRVFAGS